MGLSKAVREEAAPPPPPPPPAVPQKPTLRIVFPEELHARGRWPSASRKVNEIAKERRNITPKLSARAYLRWSKSMRVPAGFETDPPHLEGFLFPATYEFTEDTTSRALVRKQLGRSSASGARSISSTRRTRTSRRTVLIIASMVEKEVQVPRERALVAKGSSTTGSG